MPETLAEDPVARPHAPNGKPGAVPGHKEQYLTALQAATVVASYVLLGFALLLFSITFLLGDLVTDLLGAPRAPPEVAFHVMTRLVLVIIAMTVVGVGTTVAAWKLSQRVPR